MKIGGLGCHGINSGILKSGCSTAILLAVLSTRLTIFFFSRFSLAASIASLSARQARCVCSSRNSALATPVAVMSFARRTKNRFGSVWQRSQASSFSWWWHLGSRQIMHRKHGTQFHLPRVPILFHIKRSNYWTNSQNDWQPRNWNKIGIFDNIIRTWWIINSESLDNCLSILLIGTYLVSWR